MIAQALTCQFAFWECGKCDSDRLYIEMWGGAIAKRDLGIAVWDDGGVGMRSLFWDVGER